MSPSLLGRILAIPVLYQDGQSEKKDTLSSYCQHQLWIPYEYEQTKYELFEFKNSSMIIDLEQYVSRKKIGRTHTGFLCR